MSHVPCFLFCCILKLLLKFANIYDRINIIRSVLMLIELSMGGYMAKQYDELTMYKDALIASIVKRNASLNKSLGFVFKNSRDEYSRARRKITDVFAGSAEHARDIYRMIEGYGERKESLYKYFDLDTLYAYDKYLEILISFFSKEFRDRLTRDGFKDALGQAGNILTNDAGKMTTNYYNLTHPITIEFKEKNGRKVPHPRKERTEVDFKRMYGVSTGDVLGEKSPMHEYFASKHREMSAKVTESMHQALMEQSEYVYYRYKGTMVKLMVEDKRNFVNDKGQGITVIKASGPDGTLFTTRDDWGRKYNGTLYDLDGKASREDGGEIFYPNNKTKDIIAHIKGETFEPEVIEEYTEDDQIRLF